MGKRMHPDDLQAEQTDSPACSRSVTFSMRDGLRYVEPYYRTLQCHVKGRWIGKNVLDVCAKEFRKFPRETYERAVVTGDLQVLCFKTKTHVSKETLPQYTLSDNDFISHRMLFTESPVPAAEIAVLYEDERILAVNKPAGWPVHPSGGYGENSVTRELRRLRPGEELLPLHRLDRVTSGVLVFTKSAAIAAELSAMLASADEKKIRKLYYARVRGVLGRAQRVETAIKCLDPRIGVYAVDEENLSGSKWSVSEFTPVRVSEETQETVVRCQPLTGRTHQLRVHLQHLGFPIINDPCYGGVATRRDPGEIQAGIYLHAWQYTIANWQADGGDLVIQAPPPQWTDLPFHSSS